MLEHSTTTYSIATINSEHQILIATVEFMIATTFMVATTVVVSLAAVKAVMTV